MPKIFQDIWILTESGMTIYSRIFDESRDEQLFGALMSALYSFAQQLSKGGLKSIELQNNRYSIRRKNQMIFIASSTLKVKESKVIKEIEHISEKFFELYGEDFTETWNGNLDNFKEFGNVINSSIKEKVQKFLKNI